MAAPERSPIEGIVDIDSLAAWVQEYRAVSLTDPGVRRYSLDFLREGNELIGRERLDIADFPWESVPTSLQEILAIQYESAKEERTGKIIYGQVRE